MSVLISPTFETDQAPSANAALISGASGRIIVHADASSQIAARGEGTSNTSILRISTFGFQLKRGLTP